jgi:hypothetical protein
MAGVTFNERMEGFLASCERSPQREDFRAGYREGKQAGGSARFEATMLMEDIGAYVRDPEHRAKMTGSFHWGPVGEAEMRDGQFQLFVKNPETGVREMRYRFSFDGPGGEPLTFSGVKWMKPKGRINTWTPSTRLYSKIERADGTPAWWITRCMRAATPGRGSAWRSTGEASRNSRWMTLVTCSSSPNTRWGRPPAKCSPQTTSGPSPAEHTKFSSR